MTIDLYSPDTYVAAPPHDVLAELRRTQPVCFQEMTGEPGYWMVLKHIAMRAAPEYLERFSNPPTDITYATAKEEG